MKILLPIDESVFSEEAIREVAERFDSQDVTVLVLHVVAKFVPPPAALLDAGGSVEGARAEVVGHYQDLVDAVAVRLQAKGITAEALVRDGNPGKVIVKEAKHWGADLRRSDRYGIARLWANKTSNHGKR